MSYLFHDALRDLRQAKHLSVRDLARLADCSPGTISKIENRQMQPTEEIVRSLVYALTTKAEERRRLIDLSGIPAFNFQSNRHDPDDSYARFQDLCRKREKVAKIVRNFEWGIISGLLQTPEYIAALYPKLHGATQTLDRFVKLRLQRQQSFHKGNCLFECVLSEQALRVTIGSPSVHAQQLEYLASLIDEGDPISLGILASSTPLPIPVPGPFWLFDNHMATVETSGGTLSLIDPTVVDSFVATFDKIAAASLRGKDALSFIENIRAEFDS